MDAFEALASSSVPTFALVVGYNLSDYLSYAKSLVIEFIGAPIVFIMYNMKWVTAWIFILLTVALGLRFLLFLTRPA